MRAIICDWCQRAFDKPYAEMFICVGKDVAKELHFCLSCMNEGVTIKRKNESDKKALPPGGLNGNGLN